MVTTAAAAMDDSAWDDVPSLLDESELGSSALDSSHTSQMDDEDDGEMELSSSLHHSHACASDSEDDHNPLFAKSTTESPPLAHLTERQQLAYVMRESRQQRASTTKQPLKRQSASLPPLHPVSSRAKPLPTAPTTKPLATKPSMLTHDKKRRRTTTAAAIDPDDSHLYIVQRLPPAATAPAPLPAPAEYDGWSVEQRRRWDRVSEQPGLYYYHHTAPGVAQRADGWDEAEVELLQHLLVCHPLADGSRRSEASEWGLFSINLPGRVGAECERKWRELKAAGRVWSEDRFDYMRWCEQQRQRSANRAQVDVATAVAAQPAAAAAQRQPTSATPPAVLGRKRVGAPTAELPSELKQAKQEVEAIAQPPAQEAAAVIQPKAEVRGGVKAEARASAMQPTAVHARPQRQDRDRTESREQPPRKKTVRFQPTPPPATKTAPTPSPPVQTTPQAAVPSSIAAAPTALPTTTVAARRPPPLRVAILAQSAAPAADDGTTSALWPPRPPRMPLCASIVPSTITPRRTAVAVDKRIDTTQLTARELYLLRAQATHDVRIARLHAFSQAELARLQSDSPVPSAGSHCPVGLFRSNAARLSHKYYSGQPLPAAEEALAAEQPKLVAALHKRIALLRADVDCEYRLRCAMLQAFA